MPHGTSSREARVSRIPPTQAQRCSHLNHGQGKNAINNSLYVDDTGAEFFESVTRQVVEFEQRAANSLLYKFGRFWIVNLKQANRVEPIDKTKYAKVCKGVVAEQVAERPQLGGGGGGGSHGSSYALWSSALLLSVVLCVLHTTWNIYHQYKLDFNLFRMDHLIKRAKDNPNDDMEGIIKKLNATVEEQRDYLATFPGAPGVHLSFAIEVLYLIELITMIIAYILPQFYTPHIADLNAYFASIFVDYKQQLLLCDQHVREQAEFFISSSSNFRQIHTGIPAGVSTAGAGIFLVDRQPPEEPQTIRHLVKSCQFLERHLLQLVQSNSLLPVNSTPAWIFTWMPYFVGFISYCIFYGAFYDAYIIYMLFFSEQMSFSSSAKGDGEQESYLSRVPMILETLILLLPLNCSTTYEGAIYTGTLIDLLRSANELRVRVDQFIQVDNRHLDEVTDYVVTNEEIGKGEGEESEGEDEIEEEDEQQQQQHRCSSLCNLNDVNGWTRNANVGLLKLFLDYKILVRQLKSEQVWYSFHVWTNLTISMTVPLITLLHVPYFGANSAAKNFFIILSIMVVSPASICLVSPCSLHRRFQDLEKSLVYLLAHIARVGQRRPHLSYLYDRHLVSLLRREICNSNSDQSSSRHDCQFAIRIGFEALTYTSLMKFYFWFGAVIVLIVARSSGGGGGTNSQLCGQGLSGLLDDPFGVYS